MRNKPELKEQFSRISRSRRILASVFLFITVGILLYGFFEVIRSLSDFMENKSDHTVVYNAPAPEKANTQLYDLANFFARTALLSFMFFLAQLFIRLYKYNMTSSDHYQNRADAMALAETLGTPGKIEHFAMLFTALAGSKVEIELPVTPATQEIPKTGKTSE